MPNDFDFIAKYGTNGSGNANLDEPYGISTDGTYIYICDKVNSRLVKWRLHGGGFVSQNSVDVSSPRDLIIYRECLFVADTGNDRITILRSSDLSLVGTFATSGSGNSNLNDPTSIATDGSFFYITDDSNSRISKWAISSLSFSAKKTLSTAIEQVTYSPAEKSIYVVDRTNGIIYNYLASDLSQITTLTATSSTDTTFTELRGVLVLNNYLYVLEKNRVQVFDVATLTTRGNSGTDGTGNANIAQGGRIINHRGSILFSDIGNDRIMIWSSYKPERAFDSGEAIKIHGSFFANPVVAIGGKQERVAVTIGGTEDRDKIVSVEEEALNDNYMNTEET